MSKNLLIVESPAKAKTIGKILGKDFIVKSSVGHVRDLPVKSIGVDIEHNFEPKYVMVKGKKKVVDELRKAVGQCETIYLAPDPDREGEAIAWHLKTLLEESKNGKGKNFARIQYNEITPRAVREAVQHPGELDMDRVNAQQARRVLDRVVGYTVSPMLWKRVRRGLSAGRVQSVALRLVCEREKEIKAFTPEPFWVMGALVRKLVVPLEPFPLKLTRIDDNKAEILSQEAADRIVKELDGQSLMVTKVATKKVRKRSQAPFITSTMQQAASSYLGYTPSRSMGLAQSLYEGVDLGSGSVGLITYMRTDSVNVAQEAQDTCRTFISKTYGDAYCPEKPNVFRSRNSAQQAHEAIRPTDVTRTPKSLSKKLDGAELKLYELIWRRFVASQMAPAQIEQRIVTVEAKGAAIAGDVRQFQFSASASDVIFSGYMKVSAAGKKGKKKTSGEQTNPLSDEVDALPALTEGEPLECIEWLSERKETRPPARYSEASLIRALDENGVGRPSTYASIMQTLMQRSYVSREKRSLVPSDLGLQVSGLLTSDLGELFDVGFTAEMENKLDDVERGRVEWTEMLKAFYGHFVKWMENAKEPPADAEKVAKTIAFLGNIKEWAPPVKRGRRTYSDQKFVESVGEQARGDERPVSRRQLETLLRIACRYRSQLDNVEAFLEEVGRLELLEAPELQPPKPSTIKKLEVLTKIELTEESRIFMESLSAQVQGGRCLTSAQRRALDSMVSANSDKISDFEGMKDSLELEVEVSNDGDESGSLLGALETVEDWRPPSRRGRRVYDDAAFCKSLRGHFKRKGFLSERQSAALKRMVGRYHEQIENFAELAENYDIKPPQPKKEKSKEEKA